jgi:putative flippase GtrA
VGGIGTGIDFFIVFLLVEGTGMNPVFAVLPGFLCATWNNFFLNKIWTFPETSSTFRRLWIKFFIVSSIGLGMTILLMYVFWDIFGIHYLLGKLFTSFVVLLWNFFANKYWTFRARERHVHLPERYTYSLSIVIPAYNEENRIKNTIIIIDSYRKRKNISAEIIVISDGSTDKTNSIIRELCQDIPDITFVSHRKNKGKGYSVRCGVERSRGEYILMTDADNSTPIEEYEVLQKKMKNNHIAIGSRYLKGSSVKRKQSFFRIAIGRIGNTLVRFLLIERIADTQCGFKLFTHKAAKEIFIRQKVVRFGFDIEALVVARMLGYKVVEVPVSWFNSVESRIRPVRDALRTFFDIIYIKLNVWSGRYW